MSMPNSPEVKLAICGVSRDCFPAEITQRRMKVLVSACQQAGLDVFACKTTVESETHVRQALDELHAAKANALVIYLGNFGPEGPLSILARKFHGPVMAVAAAEESKDTSLVDGRGDALCGLLNASYNFRLRKCNVYIPQYPVGLPRELVACIAHFRGLARVLLGVKALKIFTFGPRPQDFYACNAPIKPLYDLGVEVMENSELDLLQLFQAVDEGDRDVQAAARDMEAELGEGVNYPDLLPRLARLEVALKRFAADNLGTRQFGIFADKCWPAFEKAFGFTPCYVNSRLAAQGMPVACEVDCGSAVTMRALSAASNGVATCLDWNNNYGGDDNKCILFHCGPVPQAMMTAKGRITDHAILANSVGKGCAYGCNVGRIAPGPMSFGNLITEDGRLKFYLGEGRFTTDPVPDDFFGCAGVAEFPDLQESLMRIGYAGHRHHTAVTMGSVAAPVREAFEKYLGYEVMPV